MIINELFDKLPDGYGTEKDDNSVTKLSDVRKTRLSLSQINKLRLLNDIRKIEKDKKIEVVQKQYAAPSSGSDGMDIGGMGM